MIIMLNNHQKKQLIEIAKSSVEEYVKTGNVLDFEIEDKELNQKQGAFVTLKTEGDLRGCIGQIEPSEKPLWQVVRDMAIEAATGDPRFYPVQAEDLEKIDYEISVLSIPEKIDNWQDIELGKHGVIVRSDLQGGVFLPQVATETGWDLEEFLVNLCSSKAGLDPDAYKTGEADLYIFTAQVFGEIDIDKI